MIASRTSPSPKKLTLWELRQIEQRFGNKFLLGEPKKPVRSFEQQLGLYDQNDNHLGDIVAGDQYFTAEELATDIASLAMMTS
jgi:hypothetical protein